MEISPSSGNPFPRDIVAELVAVPDDAAEYFRRYFASAGAGYTGRFFEQMIERSERYEFTPWDIVAVSALSVTISARAAAALLLPGPTRDRAHELLRDMPPTATLKSALDADLAEGSPASQLYLLVRSLDGVGPTKASKLLAAKRPAFVPIRDSVVEGLLQAGQQWWLPMRELARDARLRALIEDVSEGVVPANVSYLRRLDVLLWSYGSEHGPGS